MNKTTTRPSGWKINQVAYIRDGGYLHTGEAVILACLLHAKGKGRESSDMTAVQRIMKDINLDRKDN